MNCKEHHLPELELATGHVREALQAILHSILFIRSPGPVVPRDVHCEGFDLTYTRIANDGVATTSSTTATSNSNNSSNNRHSNSGSTNTYPSSNPNMDPGSIGHHSNNKSSAKSHFLDQKVDDAIEIFLRKSLTQIGPELLSGCLTLSFFERRSTKQLFGLVSHEEKVIWEQWILHVVVNNTPRPVNDDSASVMERQRIQHTSEEMLKSVMFKIFECVSGGGGSVNSSPSGSGGIGGSMGNQDDDISHIPPIMYEFDIHCSKRADDRENVYSRVANMPALLNLDG